jgi:predicted Rossmann fold nucleotide-binding protein DprA/Smf involved in DNA uptake
MTEDLFSFAASVFGRTGHAPYPESPGYKAAGTSSIAAAAIASEASRLRRMTLDALSHKPMTADEIADFLDVSFLSIRPRCSELKLKGKIKASGVRRRNRSGKLAEVWELTT